jgi:membrane associated rhomboid family serine protease
MGDNPLVPLVGASGAISGVLGGYILLYPRRLVNMFIIRMLVAVPAWVAIGLWFGMQLLSTIAMAGGENAGVAYLAHIGGFIAGLVLVKVFEAGRERRPGYMLPH